MSGSRRRSLFATVAGMASAAVVAAFLVAPAATAAPAAGSGTGSQDPAADRASDEVFLSTPAGRPIPRPEGLTADAAPGLVAREFLRRGGAGPLARGEDVAVTGVQPGARGGTVVRLQRSVDSVPVVGGEFVVDLDPAGNVRAVAGETTADTARPSRLRVTAGQARRTAVAATAREHDLAPAGLLGTPPQLWLYDPRVLGGPGIPVTRPVWRVEVTSATRPDVRQLVLVDAARGSVALSIDQIHEADRSVCDAGNTTSNVPCTAPGPTGRTEGGPPSAVVDVNAAYDFSGHTDVFFQGLGRNSLDGAGMPLVSTVRYCPPGSCPDYQNAFWNGRQMVYGQGFAVDDVVGHELAHGVTEFTNQLFYYYQSGAINESLSDIFGEFIDLTNGAGNDADAVRWLMGEDIPGIGAIRSAKNPPAFGDPDRTGSPLYVGGADDGGGVHTNSGVGNKFAYLLTDGDTFNGQTVSGIGIPKTARIVYVATQLLTSATDYQGLATALRQSCATLVGSNGITAADCQQVDLALLGVEMDVTPTNAAITQAPVCAPGLTAVDVWADDMEDPASGNWTSSHAAGAIDGWYYAGQDTIYPGYLAPRYATSGTGNLWGDDADQVTDLLMTTTDPITVPSGAAYLRFNHAYGFEGTANQALDGGVLEYDAGSGWIDAGPLMVNNAYNGALSPNTGNPVAGQTGRPAFAGVSKGYTSTRLDLSSLAGQPVRFRFRIGSDATTWADGWFIDDVRVYRCATEPAAPTLDSLTPGDGTLAVLTTPGADGGGPITDVQYRLDGGTWTSTGQPTGSFTIGGLTNGRTYGVEVRAVNGAGPGPASNGRTGTPFGPPAAPTLDSLTPGDATLAVLATPGADGGAPITDVQYRLDGGTWTSTGQPTGSFTIEGLTNGRTYAVEVRAVNGAGPGPASNARTATPVGPPVPPAPAPAEPAGTAPPNTPPLPVVDTRPVPVVKAKAVSKYGKIKVDIDPNLPKSKYWRFTVQKSTDGGVTWRKWRSYKTTTKKEVRYVNPKKGTYRIFVPEQRGHQSATSQGFVILKK